MVMDRENTLRDLGFLGFFEKMESVDFLFLGGYGILGGFEIFLRDIYESVEGEWWLRHL